MENENKPPFDPNQSYTWSPDTTFQISGKQFEALVNSAAIDTGLKLTYAEWMVKQSGLQILEQLLRKGYADGIISAAA